MHILLTDILTCPVCGPDHGLIARTDRMSDRRIVDGALGCPGCRRLFPVRSGIADLRAGEESTGVAPEPPGPDARQESDAVRIAALLGLDRGNGYALLLGPVAVMAGAVASLAADHEIIADAEYADAAPGVSRVLAGSVIPMCNDRVQGVWLSGARASTSIDDAARVLHPLGRLVIEPAPPHTSDAIAAAGMRILARQGGTVIAARH